MAVCWRGSSYLYTADCWYMIEEWLGQDQQWGLEYVESGNLMSEQMACVKHKG